MEFSYPFDIKDAEKELYKNNESGDKGFYPIGINHFWHGGIHLKEVETNGKKEPVRAIADGKVIAYRIAQTSQDSSGNEVFPNSFVLLKHKFKTPYGQKFVFYSLYMHLLPWNKYLSTDMKPKFFKKPTFKVKSDKDGDGLILRSPDGYGKPPIAVIPKGVVVTKIGGSPEKEWRKKKDYTKGSNTWNPDVYKKFSYIDHSGKNHIGYAYTGEMKRFTDKIWKLRDNKWIVIKDDNHQIHQKGLNVINSEKKEQVYTVLPIGTEVFFNKPDEAIIVLQNNTEKNVSWYDKYPEKAEVKVSKDTIDLTIEDIPFNYDEVVTTDPENNNYNVNAGDVVGYCGNKMVHLEVFASENEDGVTNNFSAFFDNVKNDNLMKKGWNYKYELAKDTEFYSKKNIPVSGKYPKGTIIEIVQNTGEVPFKNTMKVKKIGKADVDNPFFSNKLITNEYLYKNSSEESIFDLSTAQVKKYITKKNRVKAPDGTVFKLRQRLKKKGRWIGGYKSNYFEVYKKTDELDTTEYFIRKDEFDKIEIEGTKGKPNVILIKDNLNRYSENPEILFPESELSSQLIRKKLEGNKIINFAPGNKDYQEVEHPNNKTWINTRYKLDKKEAWIEKTELEKLWLNYFDFDYFFHKIELQNNEQFTNNVVNANKLILSTEQKKLASLQERKQKLSGSGLNHIQKALVSINAKIEAQQQRVDMANSLDTSEVLLKPKELKNILKKYKKYMRFCVPCHPTEWSSNLHQNDKLQILKQHFGFKDTDIATLTQRLQRLEFWETVSAAGELATDGESLRFFHPITFVSHMKKLKDISIEELRVRAFMRMIRVGEGTVGEIGYEKIYGHSSFIRDHGKGWDKHPRIKIPIQDDPLGRDSTAAGAYQIIYPTWEEIKKWRKKYNIKTFSKLDQDYSCVILLKHKRWEGWNELLKGDIEKSIKISYKDEWASLPLNDYDQPQKTMDQVLTLFNKYFKEELQGKTDLHIEYGFLDNKFK